MSDKNGPSQAPQGDARFTKPRSNGLDRATDALEGRRDAKADARAAGSLPAQKARHSAEKLLTRTTSGAIYAIVTLACIFLGPFATTVLISAEAWLCCSEFYRISRMGGRNPNEILGLGAAILLPLAAYFYGLVSTVLVLFMMLMAIAVWYVVTPRCNIADVSVTAFGPLYTSLAFVSVVLIRKSDPGVEGALLTFGVMLSVWANDAMAYFVGSAIGSHKLAPRISPNKSVEGFFGGLVGSVAIWVFLSLVVLPDLPLSLAIACGIVVGIAVVIGDLFESRIKRGVGVKDSGHVMPGHGGLLDRSDSMLFGTMAAFFMLLFGGVL